MLNHCSLPNLAELSLKACQITDEGMKALAEGLLVKKNIRKLDLRYMPFSSPHQLLNTSHTILFLDVILKSNPPICHYALKSSHVV